MIDRLALRFARFALALLGSRFSPQHRRVWLVRIDPWLKDLKGNETGPAAAELALYFGDPERARRGLRPVFSMMLTEEMIGVFIEHARKAQEMRETMRRG